MTRAGKEPAEDVKRAIRRAIELAGLQVREIRMSKIREMESRAIRAAASPAGWPHELPAVGLHTMVGFDGSIGEIDIRCAATDGCPLLEMLTAPHLQQCCCSLSELTTTLKEVWIARRDVIERMKLGEADPIFAGRWNWAIVKAPSLPDIL